ncbi:MAG: hypothetical protein K6B15_03205 [Parasporobacterium sp.]|nr:hypothetical protein [Parasporobacterium sp.]
MEILGLIGIIVGLVVFLILVYRGNSPYWSAAISAAIIAVCNLMGPADTVNNYAKGMADLVASMLPIILGGAILGRVFSTTGAAASMARFLTNKLVLKRNGETQIRVAILVVLIVSALCTMGGIDGYILTFTLIPICAVISEMVDIPRRFIAGMMTLNCAFMACPGAPQIDNIMARAGIMNGVYGNEALAQAAGDGFHVTAWAGAVPGLIAVAIIVIGGYCTLTHLIIKAKRNGEHFEKGEMMIFDNKDRELPPFGVALLPLITVFALYTVVPAITPISETPIIVALAGGIFVNLITMGRYLPDTDRKGNKISKFKAALGTVNEGSEAFPNSFLQIVTPACIAGVVTATSAFGMVVGFLAGLQVSYIVMTIIAVCIIVAITSSPPAALMVVMPLVLGIMLGQGYAPTEIIAATPGIARVGALAATTFETLPFNGLIIMTLGMIKCTHKEAYKPMFLMSVIWTLIGTVVAGILFVAFPQLGML